MVLYCACNYEYPGTRTLRDSMEAGDGALIRYSKTAVLENSHVISIS